MYFLSPSSVISLFIAVVLGTSVAPHLGLLSRTAGRAMTIGAWVLGLSPVLEFFTPMLMNQLYYLGIPLEQMSFGPFVHGVFWGCLAWSVLATIQSAPKKGLL